MMMPTTKRKSPKYSISDREVMNLILTNIVSKLEVLRANKNGILPHGGAIKDFVKKRKVFLLLLKK